jgi:tagatose 6-phosphate kinase
MASNGPRLCRFCLLPSALCLLLPMILCLGTTPTVQRTMTFARLEIDAVNRAASVAESASGKSINAARVVHTLGEPVLATGFLGGDTGAFVRQDLDEAGIAHDFVTVRPKTRVCVTAIDQARGTATELIEESKRVQNGAWDALHAKLSGLVPRATVLVLSGTLTPGAPQTFYRACVELAAGANVPTVLDATGDPLRLALPARPFVIKPNRTEVGRTLGVDVAGDDTLRGAIRRLLTDGPSWAVVTMGGDGAVISDGTRFWRLRHPPVKVVSPIGSGDSFSAGLAVGIVRGQDVPDAARLGAACGAANAMTASAGHVNRDDVLRILRDVSVDPW